MDFNAVDIRTFHCIYAGYPRSVCGFTGMHHAPFRSFYVSWSSSSL